ncbi:hypothetical protein CUN63_02940 [Pseudomonas sp. ACM7]|nr:hypothetical protein CUN63_02940 [Pseudomonas sp. ACM7]
MGCLRIFLCVAYGVHLNGANLTETELPSSGVAPRYRRAAQNLWELACSRWRLNFQQICRLSHSYREQARSHRGFMHL